MIIWGISLETAELVGPKQAEIVPDIEVGGVDPFLAQRYDLLLVGVQR